MFSFLKRMREMIASSKIVEKGDAPEDFLDQFVIDMGEDIAEAEQATRKMLVEEKLLVKEIRLAKEKIEKREAQAVEALQLGKEELARKALKDKRQIVQELKQLEAILESTSLQVNQLREKLKDLKVSYRDMELKRDSFKRKSATSDVSTRLKESATKLGNERVPTTDEIEMELNNLKEKLKEE